MISNRVTRHKKKLDKSVPEKNRLTKNKIYSSTDILSRLDIRRTLFMIKLDVLDIFIWVCDIRWGKKLLLHSTINTFNVYRIFVRVESNRLNFFLFSFLFYFYFLFLFIRIRVQYDVTCHMMLSQVMVHNNILQKNIKSSRTIILSTCQQYIVCIVFKIG